MKKNFFIIITFVLILVTLSSCYIGNGWQDTPEKALAIAADATLDDLQRLTPNTIIDKFQINGTTYMLFVSQSESFVQASFAANEKGQYHYEGDTEEIAVADPDTMILNGDREQYILFNYFSDGNCVWGYKYSDVEISVNAVTPQYETYSFTCEGKEWSIDRWWIELADENTEINIEYRGDN